MLFCMYAYLLTAEVLHPSPRGSASLWVGVVSQLLLLVSQALVVGKASGLDRADTAVPKDTVKQNCIKPVLF